MKRWGVMLTLFVLSLVSVLSLVLVSLASGSKATLSATGVISGSGPHTLTVTNTGDEAIYCVSLDVPEGVTVTDVSGPGMPVPLTGPPPLPNGFSAFNDAKIGQPPLVLSGGTATWQFTSAAPIR